MRVAVGTDDLNTIRNGHFGESKYFKIFEVEKEKVTETEIRENPFLKPESEDTHHHGEAKKIMEFLKDCDIFIARSMGLHSIPKLIKMGVKPLITREKEVRQAVEALASGKTDTFLCFDETSKKFNPCKERLA